ncbi:MAG: hypothetical protein K2V38_02745, partial [Gemmataceae bacterium]|nr:hypothetical protein [Gemmataceae bacterium]
MPTRLLLFGFALAVAAVGFGVPPSRSAPVPKHLDPKPRPLDHPTVVGTTWVYLSRGEELTDVIT